MEIKLDAIQELFSGFMIDSCVISRMAELPVNDWNATTGVYSPASKTPTIMYQGPCLVSALSPIPSPALEGDQEVGFVEYNLFLPVDTPGEFKYNDEVVITESFDNPELEGKVMLVQAEQHSTYKAGRWLSMRYKDRHA